MVGRSMRRYSECPASSKGRSSAGRMRKGQAFLDAQGRSSMHESECLASAVSAAQPCAGSSVDARMCRRFSR